MFLPFWPSLPDFGSQPIDRFFWLKFFLETRLCSVSREPLIDFLEYLEPELWLKIPLFFKNLNIAGKM